MSIAGAFERAVQAFALRLFTDGLVHNIASDAHDATRRAPGFERAFAFLRRELAGETEALGWFTNDAPRAILAGWDLPAGAALLSKASRWRRVKQCVGLT